MSATKGVHLADGGGILSLYVLFSFGCSGSLLPSRGLSLICEIWRLFSWNFQLSFNDHSAKPAVGAWAWCSMACENHSDRESKLCPLLYIRFLSTAMPRSLGVFFYPTNKLGLFFRKVPFSGLFTALTGPLPGRGHRRWSGKELAQPVAVQ